MSRSTGLLVYHSSIRLHFFQWAFIDQPASCAGNSFAYITIPCLFEEHAEAIKRHRLLDAAPTDEFVGDLGGGHELALAFGGYR